MDVYQLIKREEGYKKCAYYCSSGYPTIGIGWKIGKKGQPLEDFEMITISESVAISQMANTITEMSRRIEYTLPEFAALNEPRRAVLLSMAYQLGTAGLFGFRNMLQAIKDQDWQRAYTEGLDSLWARQTPERALRQMKTLLAGDWSEYEAVV